MPMLKRLGDTYSRISNTRIRQGEVKKLNNGFIQVATHHALVRGHGNNEQRTACDLMIIDEAHRAKGDGSAFNEALRELGDFAQRKLILTATPFSIGLAELEQLRQFVGASDLTAVGQYARDLKQLYSLGKGHDAIAEGQRLEGAARAAIDQLGPYLIRHGIDDLSAAEAMHFGDVDTKPWMIATPPASQEDIKLLLRMDRVLQLAPERKGERRNDPRFHIGWQHVDVELQRAVGRSAAVADNALREHFAEAKRSLSVRQSQPHPKIAAVIEAIRPLLDAGEKVLVFCHHRATASELLRELEKRLRADKPCSGPIEEVWREAWALLLTAERVWPDERERPPSYAALMKPVINWLCTKGLRRQIAGWLDKPATRANALADQLSRTVPRKPDAKHLLTIAEAAGTLIKSSLINSRRQRAPCSRTLRRERPASAARARGFLDGSMRVFRPWARGSTMVSANHPRRSMRASPISYSRSSTARSGQTCWSPPIALARASTCTVIAGT